MSPAEPFETLLSAAQVGAEWAMAALYRRFQPALLGYLRTQRPDLAEDLASDVWLGVAAGLSRFQGDETAFRRWLFTIGRRRLIDAGRQRDRRRTDPADVATFSKLVAESDPAGDAVDAIATAAALDWIRSRLPAAQAEVVVLRVVAGLTVDEVSGVMGRRAGAIRVLQHRALARLAAELKADPGHPWHNGRRPSPVVEAAQELAAGVECDR